MKPEVRRGHVNCQRSHTASQDVTPDLSSFKACTFNCFVVPLSAVWRSFLILHFGPSSCGHRWGLPAWPISTENSPNTHTCTHTEDIRRAHSICPPFLHTHTHTHTHPMHTPSYTCTHSQPLELTVHDREVIQRVRVSVLCLLVGTLEPAGGDSGLFTQLGLQVCRVVEDVWVLEQEGRMGVRKGTGGHGENGQAGSWGRGAVLRWSLTLDGGRLDPLCCCQPALQRWE